MTFLFWLGLIFAILLGVFIPRCIGAILGGIILGGGAWWWLFAPLGFFGFIIDIAALDNYKD